MLQVLLFVSFLCFFIFIFMFLLQRNSTPLFFVSRSISSSYSRHSTKCDIRHRLVYEGGERTYIYTAGSWALSIQPKRPV